MKNIVLHIIEEDELQFWNIGGIEVSIEGYEKFNKTDKEFLEDLTSWLKGEENERYKIK